MYQNNVEVKVCAKEDLSGIKEYYYYIDESGTVKTVEDLNALKDSNGFTAIDKGGFINTLQNNNDTKNYVVYAYAVDQAGNRSDYICSNGVVVDDKKPAITLTAPTEDDGTLADGSATITLNASEAGTYFYVLKKDGEAVPSAMTDFADSATDNGKTIWTAETGIESASMVEGDNTCTGILN